MKRGKRGAARLKFYRLQARRESGAAKAAEQPQRARRAAADSGGATMKRRSNRRERGGRPRTAARRESGGTAKVAERGEKMRFGRTSRRCANFPVCPPTSATGHPAAAHFRGRARELTPPATAIPFLRFLWARGEINEPPARGKRTHPPAAAISFFKISLGGGTTHEAANRTPLPGCGQNLF